MAKNLTKKLENYCNDFEAITAGPNTLKEYNYISVVSSGNLTIEGKSGGTITYTDAPVGFIPPVIPTKVLATTTATVVGHFHNED